MKVVFFSCVAIFLLQSVLCAHDMKAPKKCEDVFAADLCQSLREGANALKLKVETVNDAVKSAVEQKLTKAKDIYRHVAKTLADKAVNFQCSDALSQERCDKLVETGKRLRLKSQEVLQAIKEAVVVARGNLSKKSELFKMSVSRLLEKVKNLKCSDLMKEQTCSKIVDFAKKVHLKSHDALTAAKEVFVEGAANAKEQYNKAKEYLTAKISCDKTLSAKVCDKIRNMADKLAISLSKVDAFLRKSIANGVTKAKDLYKAARDFLLSKWTERFGDEMQKRDLTDVKEKIKEKVKAAVAKVLKALQVADKTIREYVMKAVDSGKIHLSNLKAKVGQLLAELNSDDVNLYKRSVKDSLVETLKNVKGKAKELMKKFLALSKEEFQKLKEYIKTHLSGADSDELDSDFEFVNTMIEQGSEDAIDSVVLDALEMAEN